MSAEYVVFDAGEPCAGAVPRLVTDGVMGGVSSGRLQADMSEGRRCLRLKGAVSLANNGGFVQMAVDLCRDGGLFDATAYGGVLLTLRGNGESYNLHLRSADLDRPWQSYRRSFEAPPAWGELWLPFDSFVAHRTERPLDLARLRRLGVVAIGRAFEADVCLQRIVLLPGSGFA